MLRLLSSFSRPSAKANKLSSAFSLIELHQLLHITPIRRERLVRRYACIHARVLAWRLGICYRRVTVAGLFTFFQG
jgi:hypothetical protein